MDISDEWAARSRIWLKAGESEADQLVRCAHLVPLVMRRDGCDLADAIDTVEQALRLAAELGDVFVLRQGYAPAWVPQKLPSPSKEWQEGLPVPDGYRTVHVAVTSNGDLFGRRTAKIEWAGAGAEPERLETTKAFLHRVCDVWRQRVPSGDIHGPAEKSIWWSSLVAVRRRVAVAAGLLRAARMTEIAPTAPPAHDADRWGPLQRGPGPGDMLERLADLVRRKMVLSELPLRVAAKAVVETIEQALPPITLYALTQGDYAASIPESFQWHDGRPAGRRVLSYGIDASGNTRQRPAEPPWAPITGQGGALVWMRVAWLQSATREDDLDLHGCGPIAITKADAAALFAECVGVSAPVVPVPLPLLIAIQPQVQKTIDETALRKLIDGHQPIKKIGRNWPSAPAMRAELLRQYEERYQLPNADMDTCEEKIATLWNMEKNTVHTYLTEARKERSRAEKKAA